MKKGFSKFMRRAVIFGLAAAFFTMAPGVASFASAESKLGYIDLQRIIETSEKGKTFRAQLFDFRKSKEEILSQKQEELNRMRKDFQQKSFTMSDRARLDREQEIRQKELDLKNLSESYRQDVLMEGRKLQTLMFKDLSDVITEIGEKEGYTLIVDKDVILYADDKINITDKVIEQYNLKTKSQQ